MTFCFFFFLTVAPRRINARGRDTRADEGETARRGLFPHAVRDAVLSSSVARLRRFYCWRHAIAAQPAKFDIDSLQEESRVRDFIDIGASCCSMTKRDLGCISASCVEVETTVLSCQQSIIISLSLSLFRPETQYIFFLEIMKENASKFLTSRVIERN